MVAQALATYAGPMRERGIAMAGWLDASLLDTGPFYEVVIAGAPGDVGSLDKVVRELAAPWVIRPSRNSRDRLSRTSTTSG